MQKYVEMTSDVPRSLKITDLRFAGPSFAGPSFAAPAAAGVNSRCEHALGKALYSIPPAPPALHQPPSRRPHITKAMCPSESMSRHKAAGFAQQYHSAVAASTCSRICSAQCYQCGSSVLLCDPHAALHAYRYCPLLVARRGRNDAAGHQAVHKMACTP